MMPPDELETLLEARKGDCAAFTALVSPYVPRLRRVARSIVGPDAADDAVQEAILSAWRGLPSFRGDASVATWLHTIVYRAALRIVRWEGRVEPLESLETVRSGPTRIGPSTRTRWPPGPPTRPSCLRPWPGCRSRIAPL